MRDESRGAHFKLDTPDRDDTKWLRTTKATWSPSGPTYDFSETIECNVIAPRPRKYKINQNNTLKLNVDNLFDKVYYNTLYRGFAAPGDERSVRVTLTAKF